MLVKIIQWVFVLVLASNCIFEIDCADDNSKGHVLSIALNNVPADWTLEANPDTNHTRNKLSGSTRAAGGLPPDSGGNWGDLVHQERYNGDAMLIRDTLINPVFNREQDLRWTARFRTSGLTQVRVLNFGRERGYCYEITTDNNQGIVDVYVRIPAGQSTRMLIEVLGLP